MIPYSIDKRLDRRPAVNYGLIAANILIFLFFQRMRSDLPVVAMYMLHPDEPQVYQFISCTFLHANWAHLLGNMIFLWVFGNAVNDSLGHVGYLAFYLAGGVLAGIGFMLLGGSAPVLGASGAISAVTGAFLVLFPRVRVKVFVTMIYVLMPMEVSSLFFLLLQFVWNVWETASRTTSGVAYAAHSAGYVFGIAVSSGLLATRLLPRDVYDLPSLLRNWRRRRRYHRAVAKGFDPFGGPLAAGRAKTDPRSRPGQTIENAPAEEADAGAEASAMPVKELELRRQIAAAHSQGDFPAAAMAYLNLVQVAENAVLSLTQQLDVANYLMSDQQYAAAADAYERLVANYPRYEHMSDIRLMLGIIYSRYLHQDDRAEAYLDQALADLTDRAKLKLAQDELVKVRQRLGR